MGLPPPGSVRNSALGELMQAVGELPRAAAHARRELVALLTEDARRCAALGAEACTLGSPSLRSPPPRASPDSLGPEGPLGKGPFRERQRCIDSVSSLRFARRLLFPPLPAVVRRS